MSEHPQLPPALRTYLWAGWPILPLLPGSKRPASGLVPHGVADATTDRSTIEGWFRELPGAGVGIALAPAGLVVIGPDNPEWLAEFERLGLPPTAVVESRPGHRHYYYRRPPHCPLHRLCRSGEYDILTNGYTVAPPSCHPDTGSPYRWLQRPEVYAPLPEAPAWAIRWLTERAGSRQPAAGSGRTITMPERGEASQPRAVMRIANDHAEEISDVQGENRGASTGVSASLPAEGPPVPLSPVGLAWWSGQRVKRTPDGTLDRSATLFAIAVGLAQAGVAPSAITTSLMERDRTLGYHKYSDRPDGQVEYERLTHKACLVIALASQKPSPPAPPAAARPRRSIITALSTIRPERVEWLWPGRVPLGKLIMLDGDPGLGKTTMLLDLAARLSRGAPLPDGSPGRTGGTVILSAEDGLADTIRPRLDAAGADLDRVVALTDIDDGQLRLPELPGDIDLLAEAIGDSQARLVIIDPLMAYLSPALNSARDQDVRQALAPLKAVAEQTGAAIVLVRHLNKSPGSNPLYRGTGSIGFIGQARAGLLVAAHPDDPERRVLAMSKNNLAAPVPALVWRLETTAGGVARVVWEGSTTQTANRLLTTPADDDGAVAEAMEFLREFLAEGERPMKAIQTEARALGISRASTRRAKRALNIRSRKRTVDGSSKWYWELPGSQGAQPT